MVDENNTNLTAEIAAPDAAIAPASKKKRAARKQKPVADAVPASSDMAVKSPRAYRKKGGEHAVDAKPVFATPTTTSKSLKKVGSKAIGKTTPVASPKANSTAPLAATDEMSDIVKLEEENRSLRKALADKLRAENAELRKRISAN